MSESIPFINNLLAIPDGKFSAIIGAQPSKGARSPLLWNAVYQALEDDCRMLPLDVSSERLPQLLEWLNNHRAFVGGAVAVPHKQAVAHWLKKERLEASAQGIFAVNSLSRNANGQLHGANTDGLAAAQALKEAGLSSTDTVLVFGFGGAAKAVINTIRSNVAQVMVVTRSFDDSGTMALANWMGIELVAPSQCQAALQQATVVMNGTVLGSAPDHVGASPLPQNFEARISPLKLAFDVVYQPEDTTFLKAMPAGVTRCGGTRMNLLQAVHGFHLAHGKVSIEQIEPIMEQAAQGPA